MMLTDPAPFQSTALRAKSKPTIWARSLGPKLLAICLAPVRDGYLALGVWTPSVDGTSVVPLQVHQPQVGWNRAQPASDGPSAYLGLNGRGDWI